MGPIQRGSHSFIHTHTVLALAAGAIMTCDGREKDSPAGCCFIRRRFAPLLACCIIDPQVCPRFERTITPPTTTPSECRPPAARWSPCQPERCAPSCVLAPFDLAACTFCFVSGLAESSSATWLLAKVVLEMRL